MENKTLSKAAAMAQFRLAVIAPVIHGLYPDASRNAYYERITGPFPAVQHGRRYVIMAAYPLHCPFPQKILPKYYSWKRVFEEHQEMWLGVLAASEQTGGAFIRWLVGEPNYSERFGEAFFKKTARSFLQSHRETARYRHAVF